MGVGMAFFFRIRRVCANFPAVSQEMEKHTYCSCDARTRLIYARHSETASEQAHARYKHRPSLALNSVGAALRARQFAFWTSRAPQGEEQSGCRASGAHLEMDHLLAQ